MKSGRVWLVETVSGMGVDSGLALVAPWFDCAGARSNGTSCGIR